MTNKISCVVVDDERNGREVLKKLLKYFDDVVEIVAEASSADEAFEIVNSVKPQLVFLDIQMPGGDGFSLLKRFEKINFEIIFITCYDQYAINAIKFNAIDYLLKPIDTSELTIAIEKVTKRISDKISSADFFEALNYNLHNNNKKIAVHVGDKVKFINENDILYIEANGRYSDIYTNSKAKYTTPRMLKEFEDFFGFSSKLVRISKSILINSNEIIEYSKGEPFIITLTSGINFEVSRRRKAEVLALIKK